MRYDVSSFWQRGKIFLNMVLKSKALQEISATFMGIWVELREDIGKTSIEAFVILYGGNQKDTLTSLRLLFGKYLDGSFEFQPEHWGWKSKEGLLTPIMTDLEIAPGNLLQVIRCKCKDNSKNQCGTNLCSCRKHGLFCFVACGECQGQTCENPQNY